MLKEPYHQLFRLLFVLIQYILNCLFCIKHKLQLLINCRLSTLCELANLLFLSDGFETGRVCEANGASWHDSYAGVSTSIYNYGQINNGVYEIDQTASLTTNSKDPSNLYCVRNLLNLYKNRKGLSIVY